MCPLLGVGRPATPQSDDPDPGVVKGERGISHLHPRVLLSVSTLLRGIRGEAGVPAVTTARALPSEPSLPRGKRGRAEVLPSEPSLLRGKRGAAGVLTGELALLRVRRGEGGFRPSVAPGHHLLPALRPHTLPLNGQSPQRNLHHLHHRLLPPHHHHHLIITLHVRQTYLQLQGVAFPSKSHPPSP